MRVVLTAIIVCAVVLMVGCGASAEQKATIKSQGEQIKALKDQVKDLQKQVSEMTTSANPTTPPAGTKPNQPAKPTTPGKIK